MGIPYTIAMDGEIGDITAKEFARGFYDAIGEGRNIELAYEEGCLAVELGVPNVIFSSQLLKMDGSTSSVTSPSTEQIRPISSLPSKVKNSWIKQM